MDKQTSLTARSFSRSLKKHMKVNQLLLFGSRARGDNFTTSDFDFVIVSEDFIGVHTLRRAGSIHGLWKGRHDLEVLCYTPEEWERLKDARGILLNAQRDGISIS